MPVTQAQAVHIRQLTHDTEQTPSACTIRQHKGSVPSHLPLQVGLQAWLNILCLGLHLGACLLGLSLTHPAGKQGLRWVRVCAIDAVALVQFCEHDTHVCNDTGSSSRFHSSRGCRSMMCGSHSLSRYL